VLGGTRDEVVKILEACETVLLRHEDEEAKIMAAKIRQFLADEFGVKPPGE
jgi:hypothetical protein